ncbi:MAG: arginine decarboxylase, partial [Methylococcaceae bacterium NSP1-1]
TEKQMPQPDIITESGRAITAQHAVLITNVTDIESVYTNNAELLALPNAHNLVEHYHDAHFALSEARAEFTQDKLSIIELAKAENDYALICQQIKNQLNPNNQSEATILHELNEKLADKVFYARYLGY